MHCERCGAPRTGRGSFCDTCGHQHRTHHPDDGPRTVETRAPGSTAAFPARRRSVGAWLLPVLAVVAALVLGGLTALVFADRRTGPQEQAPVAVATLGATSSSADGTAGTAEAAPSASAPAPVASATSAAPTPAAPTRSFADIYANVSDGVVRIETTACAGGGVGSGFLVGRNLVATVAHVVDEAESVVIKTDARSLPATVIGIDPRREVALLRTDEPLRGHVFTLAPYDPPVGAEVAAIGFPLAGDKSLTRGSVSGLGRVIQSDFDGQPLTGLIQTDTAVNPGNSGGPLLDAQQRVVGLVEAKRTDADSIAYAVPSGTASSLVAGWRRTPAPVTRPDSCEAPVGAEGIATIVTDNSGHSAGRAIAETFEAYSTGINTGDYETAYARLSPRSQANNSYSSFAEGTRSSFWYDVRIERVNEIEPSGYAAVVEFTTVQDPQFSDQGHSCSEWRMTYRLVEAGDGVLIDRAQPNQGYPRAC